jgi:radical SAM-linked protein
MEDLPSRLRIRFAKQGDLRLVSHHDLMRCLERVLRRASLPMAYSQGFNPRPKYAFPSALALGIEGRREVLELELERPMAPIEVLRRLAEVAPPGLEFLEVEPAPSRAGRVEAVSFRVPLPADRLEAANQAVVALLDREHCPYVRRKPDRDVAIDLRPFVLSAEVDRDDVALQLRLKVEPGGSARPEEVLEMLGLRDLITGGAVLVRTDVALVTD